MHAVTLAQIINHQPSLPFSGVCAVTRNYTFKRKKNMQRKLEVVKSFDKQNDPEFFEYQTAIKT